MKRWVMCGLIVWLAVACDRSEPETSVLTPSLPLGESIISAPTLKQRLPGSTLAYARVPSVWLSFAGQTNGFDLALNNAMHVEQANKVKSAMATTIESITKAEPYGFILDLLLKRALSPIEMAVITDEHQLMPFAVVSVTLDFASNAELSEWLTKHSASLPEIQFSGQSVYLGPASGYYQFDEVTQQLTVAMGVVPNPKLFEPSLKQLSSSTGGNTLMASLERQVDDSGIGAFVWVNNKALMPIVQSKAPKSVVLDIQNAQLDQVDAIAAGYGVSGGKTRLKIIADVGEDKPLRALLPVASNTIDNIQTVGKPEVVSLLNMFSSANYEHWRNVLESHNPGFERTYRQLDTALTEEIGLNWADVVDTFGPTVLYFEDEVGSFWATSMSDKTRYQTLIKTLKAKEHVVYQEREIEGQVVHQLVFRSSLLEVDRPSNLFKLVKTHVFWVEEGDHLVFASVPQLLIERNRRQASVSMSDWLSKVQGMTLDHSVLAASVSIEDLSRNMYHYYLQGLQLMADASDAEYDPFALPSADQLNFSERGTLGLAINSGPQYISAEFVFEQSAADVLAAGGSSSFIVAGILAAVAIPAYQDYQERAKALERHAY